MNNVVRMIESTNMSINEWLTEYEWLGTTDWLIECLNEWMIEWLNDWMIEWLNDWMNMNEWINE